VARGPGFQVDELVFGAGLLDEAEATIGRALEYFGGTGRLAEFLGDAFTVGPQVAACVRPGLHRQRGSAVAADS
jgi:hypothetical protein